MTRNVYGIGVCALLMATSARAAPTEQHLSWVGNPGTSVVIVWTDTSSAPGSVQYGTTAAYGSAANESGSPMLVPGETLYSHHVALSGLTAATTYHYAVPGGGDHSFTTQGAGGSFTFVAYGDQGST